MLERAADPDVGEELVVGVEHDLARGRRIGDRDAEPVGGAVLVERIGVDHVLAPDQVGLALFEREDAGLVVGNHLHHNAAEGGLRAPVVFVALEDGVLVDHVLDELPRTRAHEGGHAILRRAVLHDLRAHEGEGARHGELGEHRIVRLLHLDDERLVVHGLGAHKETHHLKPRVALLVVDQSVEVRLHGMGVELFAVRERHPLADPEGVNAAVGRDRPALRNGGMVGAVVAERDETLEEHLLGEHLAAVEMRIQVAQVAVVEKDERVGARSGNCGHRGQRANAEGREKKGGARTLHERAAGERRGHGLSCDSLSDSA